MDDKLPRSVMDTRAQYYEEAGGSFEDEFLTENKIKRSGTMDFTSDYGGAIEIPFTAVFTFGRPRLQEPPEKLFEKALGLVEKNTAQAD